jgi:hypothetical protein
LLVVGVIAAAIAAIVIFDPAPPGVDFADLGNLHIASPDAEHPPYNSTPASSGPHLGVLAEWGAHDAAVQEELFVHNLEDGGVVFAYDCDADCPDLVAGLTDIVQGGSRRLLTPYEGGIEHEGQSYRGAAMAWTKVYYFDELTDSVVSDLETFVDLYEGLDHHLR